MVWITIRSANSVKAIAIGVALCGSVPAFAQSSVTLYGIVDNGLAYQSSSTSLGSTSLTFRRSRTQFGVNFVASLVGKMRLRPAG
jgi:predicted porin